MAACNSGKKGVPGGSNSGNGLGIAAALRAKGVHHTIGFSRLVPLQMASYWLDLFCKYSMQGQNPSNKNYMTAKAAAAAAQQDTILAFQQSAGNSLVTKADLSPFVVYDDELLEANDQLGQ